MVSYENRLKLSTNHPIHFLKEGFTCTLKLEQHSDLDAVWFLLLREFYTTVMPPTSAVLQQFQAQHVGLIGSYIPVK